MEIRFAVMEVLATHSGPLTRRQIAARLPGLPANSINRMLLDLVGRGVVVEKRGGFSLASSDR